MRRAAFLVLALLALGWQSLVADTHVHPESACAGITQTAAACATALTSTSHGKRQDTPANCPLCHAQFVSGHLIGSLAAAFIPPVSSDFHQRSIAALFDQDRARSHAWQSRAPPAKA